MGVEDALVQKAQAAEEKVRELASKAETASLDAETASPEEARIFAETAGKCADAAEREAKRIEEIRQAAETPDASKKIQQLLESAQVLAGRASDHAEAAQETADVIEDEIAGIVADLNDPEWCADVEDPYNSGRME